MIGIRRGHIETLSVDIWDTALNTNLKSMLLAAKTVFPMLHKHSEKVINIDSLTTEVALSTVVPYTAAKDGVW